jgi:hypothetical protein
MNPENFKAMRAVLDDENLILVAVEGRYGLRLAALGSFVSPAATVFFIDSLALRSSLEAAFARPAEEALEADPAEVAAWIQWTFALESRERSLMRERVTRRRFYHD